MSDYGCYEVNWEVNSKEERNEKKKLLMCLVDLTFGRMNCKGFHVLCEFILDKEG